MEWRAVRDTGLAFAATTGFVFAWTIPHMSEVTRRLAAFGLAIALVVLWNEAVRSWAACHFVRKAVR